MTWQNVIKNERAVKSAHYSVLSLIDPASGMGALRGMFPEAKANSLNQVLFSTSGVHGTYTTIEDAETGECPDIAFLIVHPRLVCLRYGECRPKSSEDFDFLKKLRKSSYREMQKIGKA